MTTKEEAINQIAGLMQEHAIKLSELKAKIPAVDEQKNTSPVKKIFGFIGAIFILCGLGIYISHHWATMNSAARIIITLGSGIVFFVLGVVASFDDRYNKILTPLFLLAALFEASGLFITANELFPSGQDIRFISLIIFGVMFLQQLIVFWKLQRTSLLFITLFFGFAAIMTGFDLLQVKLSQVGLIVGFSLICICYGLTDTKHRGITGFWYFIGSLLFLCGSFRILQYTVFEVAYLGVTAFLIYLSTLVRSKILLFNGTIAMIAYIGYFTAKHFVDSTGWALALIIFGFIMLGIGVAALKINRMIRE